MATMTSKNAQNITLAQIAATTRAISHELDEDRVLQVLAEHVAGMVEADFLLVHRMASDGTVSTPVVIRDGKASAVPEDKHLHELQHNWRLCRGASTGNPLYIADAASSLNKCPAQIDEQTCGSYCCVPLVCGTRAYGCLHLRRSQRDGFAEQQLEALVHTGQITGMALRALEAMKLNRRQARTDPLTGLHNQRHFRTVLQREQLLLGRRGGLACLMVIDIDGLKRINEQFGTVIGDGLIKSVAETLISIVRETDEVARSGGDEFVVLLRDCSVANARKISDSILAKAKRALMDVHERSVKAGLHIGLAGSPEHAALLNDALHLAGEAILAAKKSGRGRIATPQAALQPQTWLP